MGSATLLHLLTSSPLADPPDVGSQMSAGGAPVAGIWTTALLAPALPPAGGAQVPAQFPVQSLSLGLGANQLVHGRWLTPPLPAQSIGAGNWSLYAAARLSAAAGNSVFVWQLWGFCVAQWRPGTGLIARAVDNPNAGASINTPGAGTGLDRTAVTTLAGAGLTLLAGDCLIVEVWSLWTYTSGNSTNYTYSLLLNGKGQYVTAQYALNGLSDTDATLLCPQAVVFQ